MIVSWLLAARPKTLVASFIPVLLGVSLAFNQHRELSFSLIVMCLTFAVLVQIATNFANDYFDFVIALGVVYTLNLEQALKTIHEIKRVTKKFSFITLASYNNDEDYFLFKDKKIWDLNFFLF